MGFRPEVMSTGGGPLVESPVTTTAPSLPAKDVNPPKSLPPVKPGPVKPVSVNPVSVKPGPIKPVSVNPVPVKPEPLPVNG